MGSVSMAELLLGKQSGSIEAVLPSHRRARHLRDASATGAETSTIVVNIKRISELENRADNRRLATADQRRRHDFANHRFAVESHGACGRNLYPGFVPQLALPRLSGNPAGAWQWTQIAQTPGCFRARCRAYRYRRSIGVGWSFVVSKKQISIYHFVPYPLC